MLKVANIHYYYAKPKVFCITMWYKKMKRDYTFYLQVQNSGYTAPLDRRPNDKTKNFNHLTLSSLNNCEHIHLCPNVKKLISGKKKQKNSHAYAWLTRKHTRIKKIYSIQMQTLFPACDT